MKFLGHILSQDGVRSDPDKVGAIVNMEEPTTERTETFPGDGKSIEQFYASSTRNDQATKRLVEENEWMWGQSQKQAFSSVRCPHRESSFSTI